MGLNPRKVNDGGRKGTRPQFTPEHPQSLPVNLAERVKICSINENERGGLLLACGSAARLDAWFWPVTAEHGAPRTDQYHHSRLGARKSKLVYTSPVETRLLLTGRERLIFTTVERSWPSSTGWDVHAFIVVTHASHAHTKEASLRQWPIELSWPQKMG